MADEVPATAEDEPAARVLRRIRRISIAAYLVFAVLVSIRGGIYGLIGLTCSAAVIMINFLWLEDVVDKVLQPTPHLHAWRLTLRTFLRFALLGVALVVTIFVARFSPSSVLMGFSIVVVGIMGEAVYTVYRSLTSASRSLED